MRGGIRQDAEKKRHRASTIRRKRRREGESGVVWTSGERDVASGGKKRCDVASGGKKRCDVASGRKERCDAGQNAQDAWDAEYPALASGRNAGGSDARSVFADGIHHLSYPAGDPSAINNGIPEDYGAIAYSSIEDAIRAIQLFGTGCILIKRDFEAAFRHIQVSPLDTPLLGFQWQ